MNLIVNYSEKNLEEFSSWTILFDETEREESSIHLLNFDGQNYSSLASELKKCIKVYANIGFETIQLFWILQDVKSTSILTVFLDGFLNEDIIFSDLQITSSFWIIDLKNQRSNMDISLRNSFVYYNSTPVVPLNYKVLSLFLFYHIVKYVKEGIEAISNLNNNSYEISISADNRDLFSVGISQKKNTQLTRFLKNYKKQLEILNKKYSPHEEEISIRIYEMNAPFFTEDKDTNESSGKTNRKRMSDGIGIINSFNESLEKISITSTQQNESKFSSTNNKNKSNLNDLIKNLESNFINYVKKRHNFLQREEGVLVSANISIESNKFTRSLKLIHKNISIRRQITKQIEKFEHELDEIKNPEVKELPALESLIEYVIRVVDTTTSQVKELREKIPLEKETLLLMVILELILFLICLPFFLHSYLLMTLKSFLFPAIIIAAIVYSSHFYFKRKISGLIKSILVKMTDSLKPVVKALAIDIEGNKESLNAVAAINKNIAILKYTLQKMNSKQEENIMQTNEIEKLLEMKDILNLKSSDSIIENESKSAFEQFETLIINE